MFGSLLHGYAIGHRQGLRANFSDDFWISNPKDDFPNPLIGSNDALASLIEAAQFVQIIEQSRLTHRLSRRDRLSDRFHIGELAAASAYDKSNIADTCALSKTRTKKK